MLRVRAYLLPEGRRTSRARVPSSGVGGIALQEARHTTSIGTEATKGYTNNETIGSGQLKGTVLAAKIGERRTHYATGNKLASRSTDRAGQGRRMQKRPPKNDATADSIPPGRCNKASQPGAREVGRGAETSFSCMHAMGRELGAMRRVSAGMTPSTIRPAGPDRVDMRS